MPPFTLSRSPRSMRPCGHRADEQGPRGAVEGGRQIRRGLDAGQQRKAQSSSSITTPSSAPMAGSISSRRSTTAGPRRAAGRGDAEQEGVADLAGCAGHGHVQRSLGCHDPRLDPAVSPANPEPRRPSRGRAGPAAAGVRSGTADAPGVGGRSRWHAVPFRPVATRVERRARDDDVAAEVANDSQRNLPGSYLHLFEP